ncbi:MAG: DUF2341 domain-containing protein, partial [Candidatus Cloacimonetes bacterium]|nr:DUF2341 domain-containing protein [Candidatus Cloacimonadota bacterium]
MRIRLLLIISLLAISVMAFGANRYARVSGNWSNTAIWATTATGTVGQSVPTSADVVYINSGITVTVDMAATCASLTFSAVATNSAITISGTNSLTVTGAVSMPRPDTGRTCTINVDAGTMSIGTTLTMAARNASSGTRTNIINVSTGALTVNGNATFGTTQGSNGCILNLSSTGTMNFGGTFTRTPTLTTTTGSTVNYFRAGTQTIVGVTYSNLTLSGTSAKTTTGATVNGILSMEGTATTTGTVASYGTGATLQYKGTGAQTTGTEFPATFAGTGGVIIANTSGSAVTLGANKVFSAGPLTINTSAILATNNRTLSLAGNFANSGTFNAGSSAITIAGTATQSIDGFTTTGLVSMTKTGGTASFMGNVSGAGLTINGNGGTLNLGTGLTHTFSGTWTRTNGTLNGGSSLLRLGASSSGTGGTFTAGTGTVEFYAAGAQTVASTATVFNNLILSGSGVKTTTNVTVNGILYRRGTCTASAAFTYGASAQLVYDGTDAITAGPEWPNGGFARNITIANANGVTLNASKTTYTGTLTNNGLLNTQNYQLTGTVSNNGTIAAARTDIMSGGTLTNNTGSTINYTTPLNIPASTGYYNLTLSASGTYNLTGNVTGISVLTLTTPTTYLQTAGYTLGYATLAGLGSILSPQVTLASANPAVVAATLVQSTANNPAYKFTLTPNYGMNFTGLSFTTTGTYVAGDIVNFKLLTNTTDTFSGATQVGSTLSTGLGSGVHSFTAFAQVLTISATRYFWITADISGSAINGNSFAISALTTSDITVSTGSKTGTAYAGGTQTILASYIALSSANLAVAAANIGQGTTNNVFYAFSTAVTGAATTLNSVAFTTAGTAVVTTDLTNFKLWYSTSNSYAGAAQIGATMTTLLSAGAHTFTGLTQAIGSGVTGYFWITADLAAAANVGRTLSVNPAITTGNLTFALGTKSGTAYAGGIQTIVAVTTTLASANPAVAASNIGFGTLKNPIYRFTLNPTVNVNMTGLNFVANGSYVAADITNFRIWSSTTDDLTTATQLGTTLTTIAASGAQQNFAAFSQALSGGVMRYFWITTDIAPGAVAAHTLTVAALTTARVTVSSGTKAGTAYIGGTQTMVSGTVTLSSTNPALPAGYLPKGAPKKPVYRFILTRDPAIVNINFTGLTFTTSGTYTATDISKFQLWYSTADNLSSAAWVGTDLITGLGTGSHSFAAFTIPVVESTAHYFWITTDLSATAVLGKTLTVAAVTTANLTLSAGNKTGSTSAGAAQTVTAPVTTIDSVEPAIEASMLAPSNAKRPLERFTLTTDGLVNVTSVNFTSSGDYSASDITKFQLWTGIIDDLTGAALIGGDITTSLGAGTHAFSSFSLALSSEEPQYFWITIDASASATAGKKISIDALGTSNFSVSAGSKTGSATQGGEQTFSAAQPWLYAIGQPVGPLVGAGTGYQLRVTVHYGSGTNAGEHAYLDQRCRSDFGDIRFFEGATELSYWIESMVRYDRAIIWVKISGDMSTNAIPFSIRFGNQSVTTTSNGGNTFLFFDDFNRTDNSFAKWTKHKMLDGSTITIPTGKNYARLAGGIPTGTYGHSVLGSAATYSGLTDGSVEYRLRVGQDAISEVGVRGTFANPGSGYKGRIDGRINYQGGSSILAPPYYTWTWLTDAPELFDSPVPGAWYHGTVNAFGTKINLLKDDVLKRSSNLATITGPGEISLQNHYGPYSDYDWVAVRKYVGGLEPAHGAWIWAPVALAA